MPSRRTFSEPLRILTPEPEDGPFETSEDDGVHEFKGAIHSSNRQGSDIGQAEHERRLFRKLGLSFFLFGLINNGMLVFSIHRSIFSEALFLSSLCDNSLSSTRPGPAINSQRHHSILQHRAVSRRKGRLAVHLERPNTIR
jgi:hypothetical protein